LLAEHETESKEKSTRMVPEFYISDKEYDVLRLLQEGKSATQAAQELHVTKAAVSMRLRAIRVRYIRAKEFVAKYEAERVKIPTRYL
jgi:DNA-binding NarL/FixJ family response regulator